MYQVYTEKNNSKFSKTLIDEFSDFDEAEECAIKAIEGKPELKYIIEKTTGRFDSYGELIATVIARSE